MIQKAPVTFLLASPNATWHYCSAFIKIKMLTLLKMALLAEQKLRLCFWYCPFSVSASSQDTVLYLVGISFQGLFFKVIKNMLS